MSALNQANIERVMNIGIALSVQRDMSKLLDTIIDEAMTITHCDGGTLYVPENNMLYFKIMRNDSMHTYQGSEDEDVDLPPVAITEDNVCSYVMIHRKMVNIDDVYRSDAFDFSGPKRYDDLTGYLTKSMMVIPLENNKGAVVGVLQLINALDEQGQVIPFDSEFEQIFRSIAAQAAIAVTNMQYTKDIKNVFHSFVQVLAAAIDERSPYSANHTKNVVRLVESFIDFVNVYNAEGKTKVCFPEELKEQIVMGAWLHDVGKIITPLEIMDKATRLGGDEEKVKNRFETIYLSQQVKYLQGKMSEAEWAMLSEEITEAKALCLRANVGDPCTNEDLEKIQSFQHRQVALNDQETLSWLTSGEVEKLSIKSGTLTKEERKIMQDHVSITRRLLNKIPFTDEYKDVPIFAARHHEKLNGKGYPDGLIAAQMPLGARIIAVMDVYEALTAEDRPYKKNMSSERAFAILDEMVADGELDGDLVCLLKVQQGVIKEESI